MPPLRTTLAAVLLLLSVRAGAAADGPQPGQKVFPSPEAATQALLGAVRSGDKGALAAIFGPELKDLLSGDERQDAIEFKHFTKALESYSVLVRRTDDTYVINAGGENWPLPVPIVHRDAGWYFDTEAGKEEILNRRIGEDETTAIGVCRTFVQAEKEYASEDRDGSGILHYAGRIHSTPGKKDGLYWPSAPGEEESPFGPLVAEAHEEGYGGKTTEGGPQPFHGYRFKILTAQGGSAPGGAYDYVINGNLIGGFALVAYPAHWGESGVMTFIVNQWGRVYERNLGADSASVAEALTVFDPDTDWTPVK